MRYVAGNGLTFGQAAVLDTLRGIIKRYGKKYCVVSHETILEKLRVFHGIRICRRTLCYWLKKLEARKLIYRIRRLSWAAWRATAYYLLDRGGAGVVMAKKAIGVLKRIGAQVLPSRAQRIAHDRDTSSMPHSGGRPEKKAAPASVEAKRCEASELKKPEAAETPEERPEVREERPVSMRTCLELVKRLDKSRLLNKGRS